MADEVVLYEDRNGIRVVTLNRPRVRNAIDLPLRLALAEVLAAAMAEDAVRGIVLTGAGGTFCSGGDISTMTRMSESESRPRTEAAQRIPRIIWTGTKPVIAAVEGAAFGAGLSLALAGDRVVAAADARFGTAFAAVGLAGDMGIFATLAHRVGVARARQLMLLPEVLPAPDAHQLGLVDRLVEPGTTLEAACADAERIAQLPPLAVAAMKRLWSHAGATPLEMLDLELEEQVALFGTEDFGEGAEAYRNKRPPVFRGR
ncbi:enoyl-CoA hydratase/isomerase family protein [Granulicoccus phenolivorans]|uniref:enoyl-CoA hydratase/isomerase family protein n=1 Tax=Granulicoccus phenolivorans TaxID=266854 RepID=UPI00047A368C|nr:enoyl-CoA hydratase-related protein [Granulicoccus phenolivorans]